MVYAGWVWPICQTLPHDQLEIATTFISAGPMRCRIPCELRSLRQANLLTMAGLFTWGFQEKGAPSCESICNEVSRTLGSMLWAAHFWKLPPIPGKAKVSESATKPQAGVKAITRKQKATLGFIGIKVLTQLFRRACRAFIQNTKRAA